MKIVIANDHAALYLKKGLVELLEQEGHEVLNIGTDTSGSIDYPVLAKKACDEVLSKNCDFGILLCGTGVGMSIAANKIHGIRACVATESYSAKLSKKHNNTNILCLGGRILAPDVAFEIVSEWLQEEYEGGRHQKRIDLLTELENNY